MEKSCQKDCAKRSRCWSAALLVCASLFSFAHSCPCAQNNCFIQALPHQLTRCYLANGDAHTSSERQMDCFLSYGKRMMAKSQLREKSIDVSVATDTSTAGLRKTASRLSRMKKQCEEQRFKPSFASEIHGVELQEKIASYMLRPANSLKGELSSRQLKATGRKPDLANRLAENDLMEKYPNIYRLDFDDDTERTSIEPDNLLEARKSVEQVGPSSMKQVKLKSFAGIDGLSENAKNAFLAAQFSSASPIQEAAIPRIIAGESLILHAETGSGKTLAYLLPITEEIWRESLLINSPSERVYNGHCLILTPTRELAVQVAGVASVLAPSGSVRLVGEPTNLVEVGRRVINKFGGQLEREGSPPRIIVGSGKAVMYSLYGDGRMPAPPTPKPLAMQFLKNTRWLVLDEVDRILDVKSRRTEKHKRHEKPAAIITSAVSRLGLGKSQVIAASATVGRPLRRELARVLGLQAKDCPLVVRPERLAVDGTSQEERGASSSHLERAITVPLSVRHYVYATKNDTPGTLLTTAASILKFLPPRDDKLGRRILLVLSRKFGLSVHHAVGALNHFGTIPVAKALLDALEADTTDQLITMHQKVSCSSGVGVCRERQDEGYLLVTAEDNIRGLHLSELDTVLIIGRPTGPDEYIHIAGRTGRAGLLGSVISVASEEQSLNMASWERMLNIKFVPLNLDKVKSLGHSFDI